MYKTICRPILFMFDAEFVHNNFILIGRILSFTKLSKLLVPFLVYKNKKLEQEICGIKFDNPVGLSAGFDKNANIISLMKDIGFGFSEVGSITNKSCLGNEKPRVHRLLNEKAIIVNYGLVNDGADKISNKLKNKHFRIPVGINIAKTNDSNIKKEESVNDYFESFRKLKGLGNYITINISCPNSGDGKSFEDPILLEKLLKKITTIRKKEILFLKISPNLDKKRVDKIIFLVRKYKLNGFVISNLTKDRSKLKEDRKLKYKGGISGSPTRKKSNEMIRYVYEKTKGEFVIVGSGGIFNGTDAYEKIKNGANLVQLITGMIYEGPAVIKKINKELVRLLEGEGYSNISEAVGKGVKKVNEINLSRQQH